MRTVDPAVWSEERRREGRWRRSRFGQEREEGAEVRLRRRIREAAGRYLEHLPFQGMNICFTRLRKLDLQLYRRVRRVVSCCVLLVSVALMVSNQAVLSRIPLLTVGIPSVEYRFHQVDFPAVGVCPNNIISKKRAMEYAQYLYKLSPNNSFPLSRLYNNVVQYGALTEARVDWEDPGFRNYVQQYDPRRAFNVTLIMDMLSSSCSEMLSVCSWRGEIAPCSDMFALRPTSVGYCCLFNSHYMPWDVGGTPRRVSVMGQDQSLLVVLAQDQEDHAYLRRQARAPNYEIIILPSGAYPLMESGATRTYPAPLNMSVFIAISTTHQDITPAIQTYSRNTRGCHIPGVDSPWSMYEWCLTECRRDAVRELCDCVPYYFPADPGDRVCHLGHLPCLNKHREKFLMYFPENVESSVGIEEEYTESLYCPHCLPDCSFTRFSAVVYSSRLKNQEHLLFHNYLVQGVELSNKTVVRVFFTTDSQTLYLMQVTLDWIFIFLNVCGACWICVGCGMPVLWETLYQFIPKCK